MEHDVVTEFEQRFRAHRARTLLKHGIGWIVFLGVLSLAAHVSEFSIGKLLQGLARLGEFFGLLAPDLSVGELFEGPRAQGSLAYWFYDWRDWASLILQTIEIAILSTAIGSALAFALSFPAARNLGVPSFVVFLVRRFLEFCRTVPELVIALIFVFAFGVGPLAGVLAIVIHTTGALGKLFSEVHENIAVRPLDGVRAVGGNWFEVMRFGVLPQVLPVIASYALLRFEINVAAASAIGIVGAGGIGQELKRAIDLSLFQDASAMILMVIFLIFVIDFTSERIRTGLMGKEARA